MKLADALRIRQRVSPESEPFNLVLACSFTPLHVETMLAAHVQQRLTSRKVTIRTGLYGDIISGLQGATTNAHALAIVIEWFDLDPRLGLRSAGSWSASAAADIVNSSRTMLTRIRTAIAQVPAAIPIAVSLPTLPFPPLFHPAGWQASEAELSIRQAVLEFGTAIAARRGCAICQSDRLATASPCHERYDFKSDLSIGFPYTVAHASALGDLLAQILVPPAAKKGIITDLDDTLWSGIVGEVGPESVCWDLAGHQQMHGLYQRLLAALASEGVLVAIASKNDPFIAEAALARSDMLIQPQQIFPIAVSWNAKSGSVSNILATWNIAADSVVFIDDSAMELAEVAAAHPGIECIRYPKDDNGAGYAFLQHLRDLFGKPHLSEEDSFRLQSIRQNADVQVMLEGGAAPDAFLKEAQAVVTFDFEDAGTDPRALDLINKTNQFNLNGLRSTPADWQSRLVRPGAVVATVAYRDRYGPLGKIAVLQGTREGQSLRIETWVMSCRAFARRIEYQCVKTLFDRYALDEVQLDFAATAKNGPFREFLATIGGQTQQSPIRISRAQFEANCPALYHSVEDMAHAHG
jgi:FkbH-like protein